MNRANVIAGVICLLFGAIVYWHAGTVPATTATDNLGGRFFPRLVASMLILASAGLIITGLFNIEISGGSIRKPAAPSEADGKKDRNRPSGTEGRYPEPRFGPGELRLIGFIVVMLVYTLILPLVGYIPASLVTFAAMIFIAGERQLFKVALGSVAITGLLYALFAMIFNMNLPEASLF